MHWNDLGNVDLLFRPVLYIILVGLAKIMVSMNV
jgi:hypothetical protein